MAWICNGCGVENSSKIWQCPQCGIMKGESQIPNSTASINTAFDFSNISKRTKTLLKRYGDAYLVARFTVGLGNTIKGIGFLLAALIFLGSLFFAFFAARQGTEEVFFVVLVIGTVNSIIVGLIFYVLGVLIAAQGQILKASLDGAVNNSPFITTDIKAEIMSLPEA